MKASQITKELLLSMGFEAKEVKEQEIEGRTKVDVTIRDARLLIGEKGVTLTMIQHLVRRIAAKKRAAVPATITELADTLSVYGEESKFLESKIESPSPFLIIDIDINGYKTMRENIMKDFAMDIAQTVRERRRSVELDPMPSFDRRIIHLALANFSDVTTESIGEGEGRYIVVRPHSQSNSKF